MLDKLRAAIIGCGASTPGKGGAHSIAYAHAWAYNEVKQTKLVAAASRTKKNIDDFVKEFPETEGFQDFNEMLEKTRPEIVSVCAFPADREKMVLKAINCGAKAIWIEKPFAISLGAAKRMMAAAKNKKVRLFINHQRRYGKPFAWLRDAAQKGIGKLISFDIAQPFNNFMDFGPHLVDTALFCLGKRQPCFIHGAVDLSKTGIYHGLKTENQLLASVHFDDGTRLSIEAGEKVCSALPVLRVNGSEGFAELHLSREIGEKSIFHAHLAGQASMSNPETEEHFHHSDDNPALYITRALEDIVAAVMTGKETLIDAEQAYRGLEIIMGIYESSRLNRIISFPIEQELYPLDLL